MAALFVAQVESFAAAVTDGIVVPRRETVFVGVFVPGVGLAAFRNHRAEHRVGHHVRPGRRGDLAFVHRNHIFAAILREAAEAVIELQRGNVGQLRRMQVARQIIHRRQFRRGGHRRQRLLQDLWQLQALVELLG
ncbi:hypothetical protein D3C80_710930 [compost metagenome]